jgi:hypothetical protein
MNTCKLKVEKRVLWDQEVIYHRRWVILDRIVVRKHWILYPGGIGVAACDWQHQNKSDGCGVEWGLTMRWFVRSFVVSVFGVCCSCMCLSLLSRVGLMYAFRCVYCVVDRMHFRRAGSSVVELSIAARRVTGSNPVSRLLLLFGPSRHRAQLPPSHPYQPYTHYHGLHYAPQHTRPSPQRISLPATDNTSHKHKQTRTHTHTHTHTHHRRLHCSISTLLLSIWELFRSTT